MSTQAEHLLGLVKRGLDEAATLSVTGDDLTVTTHCMYPSNGLVKVTLRGGDNTIVASDEGGALGEALSAGVAVRDYDRTLAALVKDQGLRIKDGVIFSPRMPIEAASLAVLLVANASQEIARYLYDHTKIKRTRDFRALLAAFLEKTFESRVAHNAILVGHTTKPYRFANVISLSDNRRLVIDPVINDASSINARVLANLDIKSLENPAIIQRIIYDDEDDWAPADLNLLSVGATPVPFSEASKVIERLAA
ncbi:MAG: hypothetical protein Q8M24_14700 [Pseudolabrys sp.]|nr:hypothetical protein [Pseudolabrys sp.]MDP2296696.1 hypothetical protein [Pseudolabrys sp.]